MPKQSFVVPIAGMHCRSCELLIEGRLQEIAGVDKVKAHQNSGQAEIKYYGDQPSLTQIHHAITELGYTVGTGSRPPWLVTNPQFYYDLLLALAVVAVLYLILQISGLTDWQIPAWSQGVAGSTALVVGLIAGLSTCLALVGGLVLAVSTAYAQQHPQATTGQKLLPQIWFNLGRIGGYGLLGGLLGVLGGFLTPSATTDGWITLLVGVIMLFLGLKLIGLLPRLNSFSLPLPRSWRAKLRLTAGADLSSGRVLLAGVLTFFLPCGFTQAMQAYAIASGNFWQGALIMSLFAVGTCLGLLLVGSFGALIKGRWAPLLFQIVGLILLACAWFNFSHGWNLIQLNSPWSRSAATVPNTTTDDAVQIVNMTETGRGYSPDNFTIHQNQLVRWQINAQDPSTCAGTILLPKMNIRQQLVAGQNIIEFTPTEAGDLPFSCSMGMYTGKFTVVK